MYVDHFGNLISNIPATMLAENFAGHTDLEVTCLERPVGAIQPAYGFVDPGQPLALINSMDVLEVAVNAGRACEKFQAGVGAKIRVRNRQADRQAR